MTTRIIAVEPLTDTAPDTETVRSQIIAWQDALRSQPNWAGRPGWYGVGPRVIRVRESVPFGAFDVYGYLLDATAEQPFEYSAKVLLPTTPGRTPHVQALGDHRDGENGRFALQIADALNIGANGIKSSLA